MEENNIIEEQKLIGNEENLKELYSDFVNFNASLDKIIKNANNPMFKNNYATVDQILETIRPILAKNNLAILQVPSNIKEYIGVKTILVHSNGSSIESDYFYLKPVAQIIDKTTKEKAVTPQSIGSAITYARRYSLTSFLALSTGEDDDGNKASGNKIIDTIGNDKIEIFRNIANTKNKDDVIELLNKYGVKSSSKIKLKDFADIIEELKAL